MTYSGLQKFPPKISELAEPYRLLSLPAPSSGMPSGNNGVDSAGYCFPRLADSILRPCEQSELLRILKEMAGLIQGGREGSGGWLQPGRRLISCQSPWYLLLASGSAFFHQLSQVLLFCAFFLNQFL